MQEIEFYSLLLPCLVSERSSAWQSASFGSWMSQVRILSLRPSPSTTYVENRDLDTNLTQICPLKSPPKPGRSGRMPKFPQEISKGGFAVRIYKPTASKPRYRLDYTVDGKRFQPTFRTFELAQKEATRVLNQLAYGNKTGAMDFQEGHPLKGFIFR